MVGNPFRAQYQDPIIEDTADVLVLAPATPNSVPYLVPKGRGPARGIGIYIDNNTPADLSGGTVTISVSGATIIQNSPLIKHSALYNNSKDNVLVCSIDESTPVEIAGLGGANNTINVYVVFFFYDSFITTYLPTQG